jgi:hypothetical protein
LPPKHQPYDQIGWQRQWHALAKLNIHWTKRQTLGIRRTVMKDKMISRPDQFGTNSMRAKIALLGMIILGMICQSNSGD